MKSISIEIGFSSNLVRGMLLIAILVAVKLLYDDTPTKYPDVESWGAWDYQLTFRLLLAFVIVLIGTFFSNRVRLLLCIAGLFWIVWEFVGWYSMSFRALRDPDIGYAYKAHKLGLILATWGHVALLVVTFVLVFVATMEIYRQIRLTGRH